jgi:uroporphyrin-3 C-methyltransferase
MNEKPPSQTPDDQPDPGAAADTETDAPQDQKTDQNKGDEQAGAPADEPGSGSGEPGGAGRGAEPEPPAPEAKAEATNEVSRPGRGLALLALILALLAMAGSAYLYRTQQQALLGADRSRADLDTATSRLEADGRQLAARLEELERGIAETQTGRSTTEDRLRRQRARIDGLEEGLARIARSRETVGSQLRREEVQHLLRIANFQLNLGRDPDTALAALLEADGLLARLADPGLQPLRRQLTDDILALRSVEQVDVEGVALRLESLARRVDKLPLNADAAELTEQTTDAASGGWARFRQKVSEFLASIFTVRRTESSGGPLLSREESFFLRRNLELELQTARVALLAGDEEIFSSSVGAARRWTVQYFDRESSEVETFISGLSALADVTLRVRLPDISGSLRIYQELQERQIRQRTGSDPAPSGEPETRSPVPPPPETPAEGQDGQT